jgi:NADPH:quinone reductase-like Zn-dependent oxidoreductase
VIFDVAGTSSYLHCRQVLNRGGVYLTGGHGAARRAVADKGRDLLFLKDLAEKSELVAVIGARYPLERIAEAHARVDAGHKKGNIVVAMA